MVPSLWPHFISRLELLFFSWHQNFDSCVKVNDVIFSSKFNCLLDSSFWGSHRQTKVNVCKGTPQLPPHSPLVLTKSVQGTTVLPVTRLKMLTMCNSIPLFPLLIRLRTLTQSTYNFISCLHPFFSVLLPFSHFSPPLFLFQMIATTSYLGCFLFFISLSICVQVHLPVETPIKPLPSTQPGCP